MKKALKRRDNKKLDYERHLKDAENYRAKKNRTERYVLVDMFELM